MHITYDTAMQLYALGFYSKVQQEYPTRNMVFCKNDICFSLGGNISVNIELMSKSVIII